MKLDLRWHKGSHTGPMVLWLTTLLIDIVTDIHPGFYTEQTRDWHIMRKSVYAICKQQRHISVCASKQSDEHLYCSLPI